MSDLWCTVLAVAAFCGALGAADGHLPRVSVLVALGVLAAAVWIIRHRLRPELLCVGVALLAAALGQRAVDGLDAPLATGDIHTEVVLVGDPEPDGRGGVTVDVRLDGRRLRATSRASAAGALDDRLAGERVTVIGRLRDADPGDAWLRHRHIAGRMTIETVTGWRAGGPATRLANDLRRTLARGAEGLPERQRSLLAGITLGDDRAQPADMEDAFKAAGLTHLLAVSGQNVAFVMVVFAPLLTRLRFGPRLVVTLGVLAMFALVTRAEPSVLRATAMASVAAVGAAAGRPASSVRTLTLGVTGMLLIDPLLATSLGFRLSVAGAAGIVLGASRIEAWLPGPRWFAAPLSVTVAAQAAVSPLLVATFDTVPLASLPANMLAAPAAGPLMVWGLTGGLVAGLVGGVPAAMIHLPTRLMLWWLEAVADAAVRWPLGDLRAGHLAGLLAGSLLLALARAGVAGVGLPRRARRSAGSARVDAMSAGAGAEAWPGPAVGL
ncbi:MAG TPA: ComEC/Rec2 family competence protein, partial [Acidimicrobiales bacterium]|nr:ComEC/Rec2 family competence protein [Acidimicrobiales bacterium]